MGLLAEYTRKYLDTATTEQLQQDWEELKHLNDAGPEINDILSCQHSCTNVQVCDVQVCNSSIDISQSFGDTDSNLFLAA